MPNLQDMTNFLAQDTGLAVVSTTQTDGRVLSSVANFGVINHPRSGAPHVAFVSVGSAARLDHIRRGSEVTVTARRGWSWVAATGPADLLGPDDLTTEFDEEALRLLLREIFQAAGGTHDDYDEYDRAMKAEGRVAVLIRPERILGVGPELS